jgi:hypothetical protein
MLDRHAGPPIFGLVFLGAVLGSVGWAATAETDPVIDEGKAPIIQQASAPVGAAASRTADFNRRTARNG